MSKEKRQVFSTFDKDDVKNFLLDKIEEERAKIIKDEEDLKLIEKCNNNQKKNKINIVSLFSGAGGLDLGTELAGLTTVVGFDKAMEIFKDKEKFKKERHKSIFNTVYTNDMFKEANLTYAKNIGEGVLQHQKDIRKVECFPNNTVVIGGFPCPGFSHAGPRLLDDERNFLYLHFIRALVQTQPEFFVAENVKGMMTLGKGAVLKQIIEDFSSAGYTVTPFLVNSRDYGVPQTRERVFLVGVHKEKIEKKYGFKYELLQPTHGNTPDKLSWVTLKEAIGDLEENPGAYYIDTYSPFYFKSNRKRGWDEQSFTIVASGRQCPLHPSGLPMLKVSNNEFAFQGDNNRRLSAKEIQRIQTFPDWYEFCNGYEDGNNPRKVSEKTKLDKVYKQIGNAVPVLLARAILQPISDFLYEIHPELKEK